MMLLTRLMYLTVLLTVLLTGMFSGTTAVVVNANSVRCEDLVAPMYGAVYIPHGPFETQMATYVCDVDYYLEHGSVVRICQSDKTWTGTMPQCTSVWEYHNRDIVYLQDLINANFAHFDAIIASQATVITQLQDQIGNLTAILASTQGAVAVELVSGIAQTTQPSTIGHVSASTQSTQNVGTTTGGPPINVFENSRFECSFETDDVGGEWCLIQQSDTDTFDWTRNNGSTPSEPTGPLAAHRGQNYIYIEATNMTDDDYAMIKLPPVPQTSEYCLSFCYHMYGFHIEHLSIGRVLPEEPDIFHEDWRIAGQQGMSWYCTKRLMNLVENSMVAINGSVNGKYSGDIAIDSIVLQAGPTEGCAVWQANSRFACSFEPSDVGGEMCEIRQSFMDNFDWTRNSGFTPSGSTGPDGAQDGQFYIFLEATNRNNSDSAVMYLPPVPVTSVYCLSFCYNMFGYHIQDLIVGWVQPAEPNVIHQTWNISGQQHTQGTDWNCTQMRMMLSEDSMVVFKGTVNGEYTGDTALDTIVLEAGDCSELP